MLLTGELIPFAPTTVVERIDAEVDIEGRRWVVVRFRLTGAISKIVIPPASAAVSEAKDRDAMASAQAALKWVEDGRKGNVEFPPPGPPVGRAENLWKTTCFEAFGLLSDGRYVEFNLSPSGEWAAYEFAGYRAGRADLPTGARVHEFQTGSDFIELVALLDWTGWPHVRAIGLSAVVESTNGEKSYWALHHPIDKPDFHHPDSFAISIDVGLP